MALTRWGAATDAGRVRPANEDDFVAEPMIFGVADGMGGHQAGEVASAFATQTLRERLGAGATDSDTVVAAVLEANAQIFDAARSNPAQRGMGTTLTALVVLTLDDGERFALVNVGDARTYRLRGGELRRLTTDHSYVQELVSTGHITEDEARTHPRRNIVTRALGIEPDVPVDVWSLPIVRGDRFVLCSDGLVDEVDDNVITEIVRDAVDPQDAADRLVAAALDNGGRDNVTVIVVDVLEGEDPPEPTSEFVLEPPMIHGAAPTSSPGGDGPREIDTEQTRETTQMATVAPPTAPPTGSTSAAPAVGPTSGVAPATPSATPVEPLKEKRRRMTLGVFLFALGLAAILTVTFTFVAVYARGGYFVGYDDDTVVIYKGRPGGVLWFDPTVERRSDPPVLRGDVPDDRADDIDGNREFDDFSSAAAFVSDLVDDVTTATTTTTTTETTTTAPTTTVDPALPTTTVLEGP